MKKRILSKKGQFSIIAALLVAVVLVTVLMTTYSLVRNSPFETPPQTLDAVNEINLALKNLLTYTIGYYCSIIQVSGNRTYAQGLTSNYLSSGLASIASEYAQWNPSFTYSSSGTRVNWFSPTSYSFGNLSVAYSLSGLGINNINYSTSSELEAAFNSASATQTRITVTEEGGQPVLTLTPQDFSFYSYNNVSSAWTTVYPSSASAFGNGTYVVSIPSGVDYNAYVVQITDSRSITVTVSRLSYYTYTLAWNSTLYSSSLKNDIIAVEALQNGSLRWLGQNLQLTTKSRPIPPIPVKDFRINETTRANSANSQVPFQVEDWASGYTVPLGISSNASIFSGQNMLVFEINYNVTSVRIWWDGRDSANQTSYAYTDKYFTKDNTANGVLTNTITTLNISSDFVITSTVGGTSSTTDFMQIDNDTPTYGSGPDYVIYNGIVRDIVQQEAEWTDGIGPPLYVDSFNNTNHQWTTSGTSPYLNNGNSYIYASHNGYIEGWFGFQNLTLPSFAQLFSVNFYCHSTGDDYFAFQLYDGHKTYGWYNVTGLPTNTNTYGWVSYDVPNVITSMQQLNNLKIQIKYVQVGGSASTVYIQTCQLHVITCPNVYSQIVVTLPANATYYTVASRTIFLNSLQNRSINDLCPISLTVPAGQAETENGTISGSPKVSSSTGLFYNRSQTTWAHHWSEFISGTTGAGIMFTDSTNRELYAFDHIGGTKTGALEVSNSGGNTIELLPVTMASVQFKSALDITWYAAIVNFASTEPIYPSSGSIGLWVLVEAPPTVAIS